MIVVKEKEQKEIIKYADFEKKVMLQFKDLDSRNYFKFREFLRKAYEMGKGEK